MYVALRDTGVQAVDWENTRQPLPTFGRYQIAAGSQTPLFEGLGQTKSVPFYDQPNPVAAFIKGIQSELGVPTTSVWDPATHVAFWQAVTAYADAHAAQAGANMTSMPMLPWKPQVCRGIDALAAHAGFAAEFLVDHRGDSPMPIDCVDSAVVIVNVMDDALNDIFPNLPARLGMGTWEQWQELRADPAVQAKMEEAFVGMTAHIASQLAVPQVVSCPTGQVLQADGTCGAPGALATTEPWYKKTSTWLLIGGGVLLVGLLIWGASKKTEAPALPAHAEG